MEETASSRPHYVTMLAFVAVLGLALVCRTCTLASESAWNDEVFSLQCLSEPSLGAYLDRYTAVDPTMGPVYFTLQFGWSRLFGSSVLAIRALSVVLGMASILVVFRIGRTLFSPRAGLAAAFYTAMSPLHIYYSQEIRTYPLVLLLSSLSMYTYVRAVNANRPSQWILHAAVNGLLAGTHILAVFLLVPQALHLVLFHRKQPKYLAVWLLSQSVALLPVIVLMAGRYSAARDMLYLIHNASWYDFFHTFLILAGGRWSNWDPSPSLPGGLSLDIILAAYAGLLAAFALWTALGRRGVQKSAAPRSISLDHVLLLAFWLFIPPLLLFVLSHTWHRCFQYRYLLHSSMALYLLAGAGIHAVSSPRRAKAAFAILAILLAYQTTALRLGPFRVDFAGAARYVDGHWTPGDRVVAFKSFTNLAFRFNSGVPDDSVVTTETFDEMCLLTTNACREGGTAWVLMFQWAYPERFEQLLRDSGLVFERTSFGRSPYLTVYRVSPLVSEAARVSANQTAWNSARPAY